MFERNKKQNDILLNWLMTTIHFIGITVPASKDTETLLAQEFTDSVVEWIKVGDVYCLFHKGRSFNTDTLALKITDNCHVALTESETQHLIGTLKRVRSDRLYDMYPDDFGLKHITSGRKTVIMKPRVQLPRE